jgi:hypothetical protein
MACVNAITGKVQSVRVGGGRPDLPALKSASAKL